MDDKDETPRGSGRRRRGLSGASKPIFGETLLYRALREGYEETAGRGVPKKALEAAVWVGAGEAFGFVGETLGIAGALPTDYPNVGNYYQKRLLGAEQWALPVFFEGRDPVAGRGRAGVLSISGAVAAERYGRAVESLLPEATFGILQLSPFEEPDGTGGPVRGAGLSWLVAYDRDGRPLVDKRGGLPCVGGGPGWDGKKQRIADAAYSPLVHCGLFATSCLNAAALGSLARLLRAVGGPEYKAASGRAYELDAGELLSALRRRGRADEAGMAAAMGRCVGSFFGEGAQNG